MKKLSKLTAIFSLCFAATILSCSNNVNDDISPLLPQENSKTAYITVKVENQDGSARTLLPAVEISNLVLKGAFAGQEQKTLASADTLAQMSAAKIEITTGLWDFTLTAKVSGADFIATAPETTIEAGSGNNLSFTLEPVSGGINGKGKLEFNLSFTGNSTGYVAEILLAKLSTPPETFSATPSGDSEISYTKDNLAPGDYLLTVDIKNPNITATTVPETVLNTYQTIVRIKEGVTTKASISDINLNDIYSITYNNIEAGDTTTGSVTQVLKFTRKTTGTGNIIIPNFENSSLDGILIFAGWYYDEDFTAAAELPKDASDNYYIDASTSEKLKDYTIYAKWKWKTGGNVIKISDYTFTFPTDAYTVTNGESTISITAAIAPSISAEERATITWKAAVYDMGNTQPLSGFENLTTAATDTGVNVTIPVIPYADKYILWVSAKYKEIEFCTEFLLTRS